MEVSTQLIAPSAFSAKRFLELFCFVQSTFPGVEALCVEEKRTLRNPVENASDARVNKRSIDKDIARYKPTTILLQKYLKGYGARVWVSKKRALLDV